ncbi:MAG: Helicase associated domain protein, partial [Planctomycetaceae bacterium]|nr:Helicase associated domain protein [Planctomycetaceae bacterium]
MRSFAEFESAIAKLSTENDRGNAFEVFAEAWLATQRLPQARSVWPGETMPLSIQAKFRLPTTDKGVDGAFETPEGITCYQVKFRTGRPTLTWSELSKFFGLTDTGCGRLVFTNCDEIVATAEERPDVVFVRGTDLDRLTPDDFRVIDAWLRGSLVRRAPKTPLRHQESAISDILSGFQRHSRVTALMACATGKTLVALWVAERLRCNSILVLVPSLALMRQTVHCWMEETSWDEREYLCVCSDPTVAPEEDAVVVRQSDLDFRVTTDAASVRQFLTRPCQGVRIIFATYQSSRVVAEASAGLEPFELGIFDEAHKTAGRDGMLFSLALKDERMPIKRRLFLTATPRHYSFAGRSQTDFAEPVYSMDSEDVYGPVVHRLPFSHAARLKIITDYRVIISIVTSQMVDDELLRRGVVDIENERVKARQVANQIALQAAVSRYDVKKIFTFHRSVEAAKSFTASGPEGIGTHLNGFFCAHVSGGMATGFRERLMREFEGAPRAVMSNARCLTEGIDVPAVDMVAFLSPRRSLVDIVQATGRAMRRAPGKEHGFVLVPLYLEQARDETVEDAVRRTDFDEVWNVLNRLREHDDLLAQCIDAMQVQRGATGGFDDADFRERIEVLGPAVSLEQLRNAITAACLDAIGKRWLERYGQLVAYHKRHGNCDIPVRSKAHKALATWVVAQRYERRKGNLSAEEIELLDRLGFTWDPYSAEWRGNYLALLEYKAKHGDCYVASNSEEYPNLGRWVKQQRMQRLRGRLSSDRIALLDRAGFSWDARIATWEDRFANLCDFKARYGHTRVPVKWKDNPDLGQWVVSQRYKRRKGRLRPEYEHRLDGIGFEWNVPRAIPGPDVWESKFKAFLEYRSTTGRSDFSRDDQTHRALAAWVQDQRGLKRRGKLAPDRERRLDEIGFPWDSKALGSETHWRDRLAELKAYSSTHGTTRVIGIDQRSRSLKEWVSHQRSLRKQGRLPEERFRELEAIGFVWNGRKGRASSASRDEDKGSRWEEMRDALSAFFKLHGHCHVPDQWPANPRLAVWVRDIRRAKRDGKLTAEQILSVEQLGFAWTAVDVRWATMLGQLAEVLRHNAAGPKSGSELSAWVAAVRRLKRRDLLSAAQERELLAIGFKWKPGDDRWGQMLKRLEHYHAQHGDCLVPWHWNEDRQLANWVRTQRFFRAAGRLSDERIKALDTLGFQWDVAPRIHRSPTEGWEVMFARLEGFVKENGHAHVPQNFTTDRKLGRWVSTQRQHHRKGRLDRERVERLQSLGFTWRVFGGETAKGQPVPIFEERWRRMFEELRRFRDARGNCRVPAGWAANPQLANWVGVQRRMRKLGRLSPERIAALDEIGFSWNPAPLVPASAFNVTDSWPDMLGQLAAFKKQFGHCRVPQRWPVNRRLADWVSNQRSLRTRGRISPDRERALADLGFDWDPTTTKWEAMFLELKA